MKLLFIIRFIYQTLIDGLKKKHREYLAALKWSTMDVAKGVEFRRKVFLRGKGLVTVKEGVRLGEELLIEVDGPRSRVTIESDAIIAGGTHLICRGNGEIRIGKETKIGKNVSLVSTNESKIVLGNKVIIENNVRIISTSSVLFGAGSSIGEYTTIAPREAEAGGDFSCGENCHIHCYNFFDTTASIKMSNEVRTGPFNVFYTHDHVIEGCNSIWDSGIETGDISIGKGSWIASHATILQGIEIGEGAVVAAGAVLTTSTGDYEIFGGVPARLIGNRTNTL